MIRLHSLRISRFRGVREGSLQGLADVNLLVGRNNSGKTTVAEAVMRVLMTGRGRGADLLDRNIDQLWSQIRNAQAGYPPELWYQQDQSQTIALEGTLGESTVPDQANGAVLSLAVRWLQPQNMGVTPTQAFPGGPGLQVPVAEFANEVTLFRPLDATNSNIENTFWPRLLSDRRDKVLTKILNEVFGFRAEGFQLLPDKRLIVLFERHSLPLDAQGDGTRAALRALMMLAMLRGTLFLMEEPESHQHPGSLERFARAVCRLAREQEVQLLIGTHSGECVRAFLKGAQEAGSEGAVFHLSLEDGLQEARRLDAETVETLSSTGVDVRFLDLYA
jgi:predicted ATPase